MKIARVAATALHVPLQISLPGIERKTVLEACYVGLPEPNDGWLTLPEVPGLGFEPDLDAIRELAKSSRASAE